MNITQEEYNALKVIEQKYYKLENEIERCYFKEDGSEVEDDDIDLGTIGEIAASHFGWI